MNSPSIALRNAQPEITKSSRELPFFMTIDFARNLPGIYHPDTLPQNITDQLIDKISAQSIVSDSRVLGCNSTWGDDVFLQPREYFVISYRFPFYQDDLKERLLKINGLSYPCVVLTTHEQNASKVAPWLHHNRDAFIGGNAWIYESSKYPRQPLGRYMPATIFVRRDRLVELLGVDMVETLRPRRLMVLGVKRLYLEVCIDTTFMART
jgi:hypothetical protein